MSVVKSIVEGIGTPGRKLIFSRWSRRMPAFSSRALHRETRCSGLWARRLAMAVPQAPSPNTANLIVIGLAAARRAARQKQKAPFLVRETKGTRVAGKFYHSRKSTRANQA